MIVHEIDIGSVTVVETKGHPPVGAHRNCPEPYQLALERMKPKPWEVEIARSNGTVQDGKNVFNLLQVVRMDFTPVTSIKKAL